MTWGKRFRCVRSVGMTGGWQVQCIEVLSGSVLITAGGVGLAVDAEIDFSWLLCE